MCPEASARTRGQRTRVQVLIFAVTCDIMTCEFDTQEFLRHKGVHQTQNHTRILFALASVGLLTAVTVCF
jgi:hypothetical protein